MTLENRTALVTGGGSGIGEAIALALAAAGCRVAIAGRDAAKLDVVAARWSRPDAPGAIVAHPVDVADLASVEALVAWATGELGRIDILVNSSGVNVPQRALGELSPDDWRHVLDVNATGAYHCVRAVLPQMRARQDGLIIQISSIAGIRASLLGGAAYTAAKFAMSGLGLLVGLEEKERGIRVTNIYPGEVETPILEHRPVPVTAEHRARILQPEDVAAAVLMVASLPPRAHVPELVIKPTSQPYA